MTRPVITHDNLPDQFGVDVASRLSGVPESTLRYHIQTHKLPVTYMPGSKRRIITRHAMVEYLKGRGMDAGRLQKLEGRSGSRVWLCTAEIMLEALDPDTGKCLGQGQGRLMDLSVSGFRVEKVSWKGFLPGPGMAIRFRVLGGSLKDVRGKASAAWVRMQGEAVSLGLRLCLFNPPDGEVRWKAFIRESLQTRARLAKEHWVPARRSP